MTAVQKGQVVGAQRRHRVALGAAHRRPAPDGGGGAEEASRRDVSTTLPDTESRAPAGRSPSSEAHVLAALRPVSARGRSWWRSARWSARCSWACRWAPPTCRSRGALRVLLSHVPLLHFHSGVSRIDADILWQIRLPRVVLGGLVGAMLAGGGAAFQGVFRNPLADPYLLGVAAGAGLGATAVIVARPQLHRAPAPGRLRRRGGRGDAHLRGGRDRGPPRGDGVDRAGRAWPSPRC